MNPPSTNSSPACFTFYRDERGSFNCPVQGCRKSYKQPASLNYHISRTHVSSHPPQPQQIHVFSQQPPQYVQAPLQIPPAASQLPTAIPLSPPVSVEGTNNRALSTPSSLLRKVSGSGTVRSPLSQSQLLSIPPDTRPPLEQQNWSESISWPPQTAALIKSLVIEFALFAKPQTVTEQNTLFNMFREFYNKVEFPNYKPPFEDDSLWVLFQKKVDDIQTSMLKSGEVCQTKEGLKLSNPHRKALQVDTPSRSTSISTPPTTPILPTEKHLDGLKLWNSLESSIQSRLFREQLRSAKDPQRLIFEWEEYCAEVRRKERLEENVPSRKGQSTETRRLLDDDASSNSNASEHNPRASQVLTPFVTPPPPTKANDLKSMIESRLREAHLKRQRAKEAENGREKGASKRIKIEPE
ncbi:hypothetical protein EG329_002650 [Mollisiaceae sp. DMI_Dod_QoI]|nr:hypothetical protein EG329_002650 [Helotiales sp. DMI_Dod_QoI]